MTLFSASSTKLASALCYALVCLTVAAYTGQKRTLSNPRGASGDLVEREFTAVERAKLSTKYVGGTVVPKPQFEQRDNKTIYMLNSETFSFTSESKNRILSAAFARYKSFTFPDKISAVADDNLETILSLSVAIERDEEEPELKLESDESYTLKVQAPESQLKAKTVWGALRGLETFSQLVYQSDSGQYRACKNNIIDYPRFQHRGFLIDTSRHYLPLTVIFKFLDAMSFAKYNLLHWHIVDDPSFPYVSKTFPQLHNEGSRNPKTHVYEPEDVQDVIEYAKLRGIRVMPEFDTPGHTRSWHGIDGLLTECYTMDVKNGVHSGILAASYGLFREKESNYGPINPTKNLTYNFLEKFFKEVASVFPDKYIHLGGDEVEFDCWESNKKINEWMDRAGMSGLYEKLESYYLKKLIKIIDDLGKNYIVWQEVFDNGVELDKDTVVNVWKDENWQDEMRRVTDAGHKVILSSCWYLNYIDYGLDWPPYYECDPEEFGGTQAQRKLVMGGTAAMWGEYVDATNILSRTWARGLPVAERLWSAKNVTNPKDALYRFWEHRCRYLRRGIPAEDILRSKFCRYEWDSPKNKYVI